MSASVFCTEIQPSPRRAARRSPGSDRPPTEIGTGRLGRRRDHEPVEVVVLAVVLDPLRAAAAAHEPQDLDHLVGALAARLHVGVRPRELLGDPAEPDAETDAVVREHRHRRELLRDEQRVADRELDDVGEEADALGHRGHRRDRDERVDERGLAGPEARRRRPSTGTPPSTVSGKKTESGTVIVSKPASSAGARHRQQVVGREHRERDGPAHGGQLTGPAGSARGSPLRARRRPRRACR